MARIRVHFPVIGEPYVAFDTVDDLVKSIPEGKQMGVDKPSSAKRMIAAAYRNAFGYSIGARSLAILLPRFPTIDRGHCNVCIAMGVGVLKECIHSFLSLGKKVLYIFDVWEHRIGQVSDYARHFGIDVVFVTASQSADLLRKVMKGKTAVEWMPEGVKHDSFMSRNPQDRDIDILHFGRRYERFHNAMKDAAELHNLIYLYEKAPGQLVFPTREAFVEGLSRSKISICVPGNLSCPSRTGGICTVTTRYFQSMASKCIVLGHAPQELQTLFGYNPVVEISYENVVAQVVDILGNYSAFLPLIEKNYRAITTGHTWRHRWEKMLKLISVPA